MKAWPACLLLLGALCAGAAGEARLRFTRLADLPDSGLRLLLLAGAEADPLPPPAILDGFRESGGTREKLELQSPLEMWRWKQREGRWVDARGNRLILAAVALPTPDRLVDWLPRDEVARLFTGPAAPAARVWAPEELARWLDVFWGVTGLKAEPLTRSCPFALAEAFLFRKSASGPGMACAFRVKASPERWHVVLLEINSDITPANAEKAFVEDLLPSIQSLGRRAVLPGTQPLGVSPPNQSITPREESLRRARESIRNMKGWWAAEGSNTVVLSNIKSGKSQLVDAILEDLETIRPLWEAVVPPWEKDREVAVIRVFGAPEDYVRYVGPEQAWTAGLWVPAHRELAIRPLEEGSALRNRRAVLGVVYHEAFHQYLDEAFMRVQAAPWFNEGYAQLFASFGIIGKRVKLEKDPGAAAILSPLSRAGQLDPAPIFGMDYREFYAGDETARRQHYALAWGLMYFLQEGGRKSEPWRAIPARYAAALRETRDSQAATARALAGVDMKALAEAMRQFYR